MVSLGLLERSAKRKINPIIAIFMSSHTVLLLQYVSVVQEYEFKHL